MKKWFIIVPNPSVILKTLTYTTKISIRTVNNVLISKLLDASFVQALAITNTILGYIYFFTTFILLTKHPKYFF